MNRIIKEIVKYGVMAVLIVAELVLIGCAMAPDVVTPCWIDKEAAEFAGVNIPGLLPYTSLLDAEKVARGMDFVHIINQLTLGRLLEDENLKYSYLKNAHTLHLQKSRETKEAIFSPTGAIGILLSGGIFGTLGALFIPRLAEKKKVEEAKENGRKEANNK